LHVDDDDDDGDGEILRHARVTKGDKRERA
jgi:hypothetical protein